MSDIEAQLRRAITTASNDDMSEPKTEKRERHVQRLTAMTEAIDELATLRSLTAELVEALSDLLFLSRTDAENSVDAYERVAERFYAETGMLAPGKDQPAELPTPTFEERQEAYSAWLAGFKHRAREVLSRARAKEDT